MIFQALVLGLAATKGQAVLDEVVAKLKRVHSLSVTLTTQYPVTRKTAVEQFWVLDGSFFRYIQGDDEVLTTPTAAWFIWPKRKTYQPTPLPPKGSPRNPFTGMPGLFGESDMKAIGDSGAGKWHGQPAIAVVMDTGSKFKPKARLVYYFHPDTKLPLGFLLRQGKFNAEGVYSNLKINPPLKPSDFAFKPGKDWKVEKTKRH